ncbi:MAG TPA: hypothetical protein VGP93_05620 [Polyangiaceae bacterium]|nr:hypothetical protein [Polyangiaceae bacterium]
MASVLTERPLWLLIALMGCGSGGDHAGGSGGAGVTEDPRTMTEICAAYCDNASAHGCESELTFGGSCQDSCNIPAPGDSAECAIAWKNHTACLADVPNVCDAQVRDAYCLDAYCRMRRACDLPDPKC